MRISVPEVLSKLTWIMLGISVIMLNPSYPAFCAEDTPKIVSSVEADRANYRATHLPWAVEVNPERVGELIKNGADVNAIDEDGRTALHLAVFANHYGTVKLLLDKGANVNVKEHSSAGGFNGWGWYPLHLALRSENKDIIRLLIDHGADVNALRTDNWPPLYTAAYHGQPDMIALLISKGANVNFGNGEPLRMAISQGKTDAAKMMIKLGAKVNGVGGSGQTALHVAVNQGDIAAVKLLLANKAKIDIADNEGKTPLFYAAYSGYIDIAQMLVAKGASVKGHSKANVSLLQAVRDGKKAYKASHQQNGQAKRDWYGVRRILLRHGGKE